LLGQNIPVPLPGNHTAETSGIKNLMHHPHDLKSCDNNEKIIMRGRLTPLALAAFSEKVAPGRALGFFNTTRAQSRMNCKKREIKNQNVSGIQ